ncbi:unnamed protein product [Mytilus coruscus]|uniref:DUF1758 domain-containing protein n=1 Tax=Mytilus coruscus TaxID=42192 RepID=A0A6J7ZQS9_MYTCO|nr:unnamed protein product [Mytilus coruscus]
MAVSYLKGLCTRYNNLLAKELDKSGDIIAKGIDDESVTSQLGQQALRRIKNIRGSNAGQNYRYEENRFDPGPQSGAFDTITDTNARADITVSTVTTTRITEEKSTFNSKLYDDLERHLRSLDALHQDVTQDVFISMITSKLPKEVLIQLEIQKGHNERWTVGKLRQFFNIYITAREAAESQSKETHTGPSSEEKLQSKIKSNSTSSKEIVPENSLLYSGDIVLMQTAQTTVSNIDVNETELVRLLMNSGSQRTYITENLAKRLNLKKKGTEEITLVTFGPDKPKTLKNTKSVIKDQTKRWSLYAY